MGALSTTYILSLPNLLLRGTTNTLVSPGAVYIGLYTADPTSAGSGPECTTGNYSGYARVLLSATTSATDCNNAWTAPVVGMTQNVLTLVFPAMGSASPLTVTHWGIHSSVSTNTLIVYGPLTASKTLNQTDVPSFPAGSIQITFS